MNDIRAAFAGFWGGFVNRGQLPPTPIRAYHEMDVAEYAPQGPKPPDLPYITYSIASSPFSDFAILTGRIWTRSSSWGLVDDVLAQAAEKIPEGGILLKVGNGGAIWLLRSTPFADYLPPEQEGAMEKAGVVRVVVKSYVL